MTQYLCKTYRQLGDLFIGIDKKRPKTLHVFHFEERNLGNSSVLLEQVERAGLSSFASTGHARKVKGKVTWQRGLEATSEPQVEIQNNNN